MNLWRILDVVILGWIPLSIEGTFSRDVTIERIRDLNHPVTPAPSTSSARSSEGA